MASFKDVHGQTWDIDITFGSLMRVKSQIGITLVDLTESDRKAGPMVKDDDGRERPCGQSVLDREKLAADTVLLVNTLYVLCEPQCSKNGIDDKAFGERLDIESVTEAIAALEEGLVLFSLPRNAKGQAKAAMAKRAKMLTDLHMAPAIAKVMNGLEALSNLVPTSQASPESTSTTTA